MVSQVDKASAATGSARARATGRRIPAAHVESDQEQPSDQSPGEREAGEACEHDEITISNSKQGPEELHGP
jgi:hypothetical protein